MCRRQFRKTAGYIGNLLKAGRGGLAAAIPAMPTYARSAIVAETSMRTFGLNGDAIAALENALKADMAYCFFNADGGTEATG